MFFIYNRLPYSYDMINQEILYALIISSISGDISAEDSASLNKILAESAKARKLYEEMYNVIKSDALTKAIAELPEEPVIPSSEEEPLLRIPAYDYRIWLRIVAVIAVIVSGWFIYRKWESNSRHKELVFNMKNVQLAFDNGQAIALGYTDTMAVAEGIRFTVFKGILNYAIEESQQVKGMGTLKVPAGKYYDFVLSDGTKVYVSPATKIRFPFAFNGQSRDIWVEGQAFFEVTHNDKKPFLIHLKHSTVEVLGTEFNVNSNNEKETISLVKGKVRVITEKDSITLKPATEVVIQEDSTPIVSRFSVENILGQKNGIITYYKITLDELANEIKKYYNVDIKLEHPVSNKKFYGAMNYKTPIKEFLDDLVENNQELSYSMQNDIIYINNQPVK